MEGLLVIQEDAYEQLVKFQSNLTKLPLERRTIAQYTGRLETLNTKWANFQNSHKDIMALASKDKDYKQKPYFTQDIYTAFEELYFTIYSDISTQLTKLTSATSPLVNPESKQLVNNFENTTLIKLPCIDIPKFSGSYHEWIPFRDLYISLIHDNSTLSKVQKLHYLKSNSSGEPAQLLRHVQIAEVNYDQAWKSLSDRYENKRAIVNALLTTLTSQPALTQESAIGIRKLLDSTAETLIALTNMGVTTDSWGPLIVFLTVQKLDIESRKLWEQSLEGTTELSTLPELKKFLENRFRTLEIIKSSKGKQDSLSSHSNAKVARSTRTFHAATDPSCPCCSGHHFLYRCESFINLPVEKRREFVSVNRLCHNCMVAGHFAKKCRQKARCRKCEKRYHTLLHSSNPVNTSTTSAHEVETSISSSSPIPVVSSPVQNHLSWNSKKEDICIMLATALVSVGTPKGVYILRALIDQGSESSLITEAAVQLLDLPKRQFKISVSGIGGVCAASVQHAVTLNVRHRDSHSPKITVEALVMPKLTNLLPSQSISPAIQKTFNNLDLADPTCFQPGKIDLLLGADVLSFIMQEGIKVSSENAPIAQKTLFGWIISGRCNQSSQCRKMNCHVATTLNTDYMAVDTQLRKFWEIEEPSKANIHSPLDEACENFFLRTYTRNDQGRFIVHLPFRNVINGLPCPVLGSSKQNALKRLYNLEKKLSLNPKLQTVYKEFMSEYLTLGHMELVKDGGETRASYYIPHHAVRTAKKFRVVFDASSTTTSGESLNDVLAAGPKLQNDLSSILLRWRMHRFVLTGDITKMYRQILVSNQDADFQRILWRDNPLEPVREYRLLTVTYGTSSAPYLAIKTLHELARLYNSEYPEAAILLRDQFYVDDVMFGCDDKSSALKLQDDLISLLNKGGFDLRKWSSNCKELLRNIPIEKREPPVPLLIGEEEVVKTLGVYWSPTGDHFEFNIQLPELNSPPTKRSLLSDSARLFDPLGWLAPSIVIAKIFFQNLWLLGLSWDQQLPNPLKTEWLQFREELGELSKIKLSRWIYWRPSNVRLELHGFADASSKAYAAVVYSRVVLPDGQVIVSLLTAKSRVAPVKQVSVPRLELCAALLLSQLLANLKGIMNVPDLSIYAWSDSTIVLAWLRSHPSRWKTYVANRVSQIQEELNSSQWHHVVSAENPADCATRGVRPSQLAKQHLWWKGPTWLAKHKNEWPSSTLMDLLDTNTEERKIKLSCSTTISPEFDLLNRFSSLIKLIRVTAVCLRFIHNCRSSAAVRKFGHLAASELNSALIVLCKVAQAMDFPAEIQRLSQKSPVKKSSKIVSLDPYLDQDSVLRVGGRLHAANLPTSTKHQIILSSNNPLSALLADSAHITTLHGGIQLVLAHLRRKYWITHARSLVKRRIRKCITCVRYNAKAQSQLMGSLPEPRVNPKRAFLHSGVDYAGPINIRASKGRGHSTFKGYICLFVCLVTKAIHLEPVGDYTSNAFIATFKRFVARRGKCLHLYSDCGTNFLGADTELKRSAKAGRDSLPEQIASHLADENTTWHFIPPSSPHFGGLWEAGVKSTKGHLKRVIGTANLTFEELATVLCQIEATLNSRPLCPLSNEPEDYDALTPGHFLIGEPPIAVPEPSLLNSKENLLSRWQQCQRIVHHFWQRWSMEYSTRLQQRPKWSSKTTNLVVGDLVLIKEERIPPGKWLLGRVIATHPGADGVVRVATVRTKSSILKRPVTKLCLLPIPRP